MELFIVLILFIAGGYALAKIMGRKRKKRFDLSVKEKIGIRKWVSLSNLLERLESSLAPTYIEQVKKRVLDNGLMEEQEFPYYLMELKRFFMLSAILKHTPMYNDKVDEIWHEMLIFTKEYQEFCQNFTGEMIHHYPNIEKRPNPNERAWFDLVYSILFETSYESMDTHGRFFQNPLDVQIVTDFHELSTKELKKKYFCDHLTEEAEVVVNMLIKRIRSMTHRAKKLDKSTFRSVKSWEYDQHILIMVYLSWFYYDTYIQEMQQVGTAVQAASSSSSFPTYTGSDSSCSSDSSSCSSDSSSCSSSSSSCSSCGGGCSS
ncbi:hypothetical protein ACFDTO_38260 [Microbacteriaceae bacterium 4G12]